MVISHVAVLIPARDEEGRIDRCLRSVLIAKHRCEVDVSVIVVADGCLDRTAARARGFDGVEVVEINESNVGAARRMAVQHALRALTVPTQNLWLANTDADSIVPENWITAQIEHADAGCDVVIGTVRPDPDEYPLELQREWERTHIKGRPNGHVHGANLGVRASSYLDVGGYQALPEHEDVDLVARLAQYVQLPSDDAEVITSARLVGRTPGGYAAFLEDAASRRTSPHRVANIDAEVNTASPSEGPLPGR